MDDDTIIIRIYNPITDRYEIVTILPDCPKIPPVSEDEPEPDNSVHPLT
jgi:hypothetical protein